MENNLTTNILQAVKDFHDIKTKIVSKGINMPLGTKTSEYAGKIDRMQKADNNWLNADLDKTIPTDSQGLNSLYKHSNGKDIYLYSSLNYENAQGIWHINLDERICRQIISEGYNFNNFFESSSGGIYVSSATTIESGLYYIEGKNATKIKDEGRYFTNYIEDESGNIYCSCTSNAYPGIYKLTPTAAATITSQGYNWKFVEGINSYVYAGGDNTETTGILAIKDGVVTTAYSETRNWINKYTAKNGDLYMSSNLSGTNGLVYLKNGVGTKIFNDGIANWRYFYEDNSGRVYMTASGTGTVGILSAKDGAAKKIISTGADYQYYYERDNGEIYASSSASGNAMVYIKDAVGQVVTGSATSGYFRYFFETSTGDIYVGNSTTGLGYGLYYLNEGTATKIITEGSSWRSFYESLSGEVYVGTLANSSISYGIGLYKLDGDSAEMIFPVGVYWNFIKEEDGILYFVSSSTVTEKSMVLKVIGSNAEEYFRYE